MKYQVKIIETLERVIEVDAADADAAIDEIKLDYNKEKIVLDAEDFVGMTIIVI